MKIVSLHDKQTIEAVLRKDVYLNIYGIGDLDDFFWPYTIWFASESSGKIEEIALLYFGCSPPALLAFCNDAQTMTVLLESISHMLPRRFYAHLSPGVEAGLKKIFRLTFLGIYLKKGLFQTSAIKACQSPDIVKLTSNDLPEIRKFYQHCYPENRLDPRMLETGQYYGIRKDRDLVSVCGIHVYSPKYKVAALGNVATAPEYRKQGAGTKVIAKTCQSLFKNICHIGLNVKKDNHAAVSCYSRLGFKSVNTFNEYLVQL